MIKPRILFSRMCSLAVALGVCLSLTGCLQAVRLKDRAIVQAVGVDYKDDQYSLTFQYFLPEGGGGQTTYDTSKLNNAIVQGTGSTLSEAVDNASRKDGKQLFFGSNKIIVIGGDMAEKGIRKAVDYFNSNHQLHPSVYMLTCLEDAETIVSAQIPRGIVPAAAIEQLADTARSRRHFSGGRMVDVVTKLERMESSVNMPLIALDKSEEKPEVIIEGAALYKGDKMVDVLTDEEVQGILWLEGEASKDQMVVDLGEMGKCSLQVLTSSSKIRPRLEDDHVVFDVQIKSDSSLRELIAPPDKHFSESEILPPAMAMQEKKIERLVNLALNKSIKQHQSDIFRLGDYVRKYLPDYYLQYRDDYDKILENAQFQVKISCNISRMGLEAADNKR